MIQLPKHPEIDGARYFGNSKLIIHGAQNIAEHHYLKTAFAVRNPELLETAAGLNAWGTRTTRATGLPSAFIAAAGSAYDALGMNSAASRTKLGFFPYRGADPASHNGTTYVRECGRVLKSNSAPIRLMRQGNYQLPSYSADSDWTGLILTTADSMLGGGADYAGTPPTWQDLRKWATVLNVGGTAPMSIAEYAGVRQSMFQNYGAIVFTRIMRVPTLTVDFLAKWASSHELTAISGGPAKLQQTIDLVSQVLPKRLHMAVSIAVFPDGGAFLCTGRTPTWTRGIYNSGGTGYQLDSIMLSDFATPIGVANGWIPGMDLGLEIDKVDMVGRVLSCRTGIGSDYSQGPLVNSSEATAYSSSFDVGVPAPRTLFGVPLEAIFGPAFAEVGNGAMTEEGLIGLIYDRMTLNTGSEPSWKDANGLLLSESAFVTTNGSKPDDWLIQGYASGLPAASPIMGAYLCNWVLCHLDKGVTVEAAASELVKRSDVRTMAIS